MGLIFLTGGIRSGKTSLAVRWAEAAGSPLTYIATAEPGDAEMTARIAHHRAERSGGWTTIEEPLDLEAALLKAAPGAVVIDCLTLWVSNLMHAGVADQEVLARCTAAIEVARASQASVYVVTNEVGSGIVPENALARWYEELLGKVNLTWARAATDAYLVVAGRTLRLEPPE